MVITRKQKDVRPTKLVCFGGIAKHHSVNIMLFEPKEDRGDDAGFIRRLFYGKIQYKSDLPTVNMGLFRGHCFTSKRWMYFVSDRNVKVVSRYLHETRI